MKMFSQKQLTSEVLHGQVWIVSH